MSKSAFTMTQKDFPFIVFMLNIKCFEEKFKSTLWREHLNVLSSSYRFKKCFKSTFTVYQITLKDPLVQIVYKYLGLVTDTRIRV